jgi:hypothetical protein
MPTLTLAIPEELKKEMESMPELNWSEIARRAISEKAAEYKLFRSVVAKSKLTEKDANQIGLLVKDAMYKGYKKKG